MPHPISKQPTRPLSHSLYPEYKSGLRTPVQRQFSLELARCSSRVSHSNKLHFPLVLSHVWKILFQLMPRSHHFWWPIWGLGVSSLPPHFSFLIGTLCEQASAVEATEELWPGLPSGVFQMPHCSKRPSSCCPNGRGSLLVLLSN